MKHSSLALIFVFLIFLTGTTGCLKNPLGTSSVQSPNYRPGYLVKAPEVNSVSPKAGSIRGGTLLTVTGKGFLQGAQVLLDDVECLHVEVHSDTKLTCVTPSHKAAPVALTVKNPDTQSGTRSFAFRYFGVPNPVGGIGHVIAGGIAGGTGVQMKFTANAVGMPPLQSGTGVRAKTGPLKKSQNQ